MSYKYIYFRESFYFGKCELSECNITFERNVTIQLSINRVVLIYNATTIEITDRVCHHNYDEEIKDNFGNQILFHECSDCINEMLRTFYNQKIDYSEYKGDFFYNENTLTEREVVFIFKNIKVQIYYDDINLVWRNTDIILNNDRILHNNCEYYNAVICDGYCFNCADKLLKK